MTNPVYCVTDPSSGDVIESFDHAQDADIEAALTATQDAYTSWRDVPIADRATAVKKVAALFGERAEELAKIATLEMGKPHHEGVEEAQFCQAIFEYFATEGPTLTADQPIKGISGGNAMVQRLPIGPLLGIMPWNFPFYQVARFAAPNLMLGNTIILKHAESTPRSALAIADIMRDAGMPEGTYVNVFATFDQISTIIADPRVQGVSLTGSERAGSTVAAQAGQHLTKCVLALGGSDPMVVLDSTDVAGVATQAWEYRTYNTGQACNSNKRMIVMEDIFDDFVSEITAKAQAMETFSPLSSRAAAEKLHEQVQDAVDKGATLHAGGVLSDGPDAHYSPAVLTGITEDMRAYREELFGPVAVVYKVTSDDEALTLANDTDYGLGGSVFSEDTSRAQTLAQRLEVGMSNVNTTAGEGAEVPFGGVKRSGFGRELGPLGMDEFVNKRMYYVAD